MKYVIMCSVTVKDPFNDYEIEEYSGTYHDTEASATEEYNIAIRDPNVCYVYILEKEV